MRTDLIRTFINDLPPLGKCLPAAAIAGFVAVAVTVLPSFTPKPGSNLVAKADRLQVASVAPACAEQNWPNIDASCLKSAQPSRLINQVRLVTTDRQ